MCNVEICDAIIYCLKCIIKLYITSFKHFVSKPVKCKQNENGKKKVINDTFIVSLTA